MKKEKELFAKWKKKEKVYWEEANYTIEETADKLVVTGNRSLTCSWNSNMFNAISRLFSDCDFVYMYQLESPKNKDYYVDFVKDGFYFRFAINIFNEKLTLTADWFETEVDFLAEEGESSFDDLDQTMRENLLAKYTVFRQYIVEHPRYRLKLLSGCMEIDEYHNPFQKS